ncbi:GNAT family N-acetyltransferase [Lentzea nigeriaca]|uniref:GNAT family N-acetyltransferase n=1 Tax=Lentzea nigeriaca TaxID=1128665 RepID=UPI00195EAF0A|nr:GNAT family N-acetyltransferase [Lentzea nigeriaca]MBM7859055.1 GNAT superfamily N-acetyltransferase [Lentzea nigeriaca]
MIRIVPSDEVPWEDVEAIFDGSEPSKCHCQRYKVKGWFWRDTTSDERYAAHCSQSARGSGLVAYVDGQPAGWVAVEPRCNYAKLLDMPIPWKGRSEDKHDPDVWAVTCFVVRKAFRRQGLTYELAAAAVSHARENGARAIEAYPMIVAPGQYVTWGEMHVGTRQVFEEAGFSLVTHPTKRRVVMRVDF